MYSCMNIHVGGQVYTRMPGASPHDAHTKKYKPARETWTEILHLKAAQVLYKTIQPLVTFSPGLLKQP